MIETVFKDKEANFEWIDVTMPTQEDFQQLSEIYKLHPASVKDCLAPMHLPKFERIEGTTFMITRVYDETASADADNVRQLTNKIAVFMSERFIITIHRKDEPFLVKMKSKWTNYQSVENYSPDYIFNQLLHRILRTYDSSLNDSTEELDEYEKIIFEEGKSPKIIKQLYIIKRRASVFKRMLFMTKDTVNQFARFSDTNNPFTQNLIEYAENQHFMADSLHENVNSLLNLHLGLSSHRSNEVMGLLTIISMFFLPLTFITGLYGMNFKYMPELTYEYGYSVVIFIMLGLSIGTYVWFKKKGWF